MAELRLTLTNAEKTDTVALPLTDAGPGSHDDEATDRLAGSEVFIQWVKADRGDGTPDPANESDVADLMQMAGELLDAIGMSGFDEGRLGPAHKHISWKVVPDGYAEDYEAEVHRSLVANGGYSEAEATEIIDRPTIVRAKEDGLDIDAAARRIMERDLQERGIPPF